MYTYEDYLLLEWKFWIICWAQWGGLCQWGIFCVDNDENSVWIMRNIWCGNWRTKGGLQINYRAKGKTYWDVLRITQVKRWWICKINKEMGWWYWWVNKSHEKVIQRYENWLCAIIKQYRSSLPVGKTINPWSQQRRN